MKPKHSNKLKILNDPVYGFISIPHFLIFDLIEHPFFQRLRRIKQLGTGSYVYPGALHTRFHHTLGAMHLTKLAVDVLKSKEVEISEDEEVGVIVAILLHDIGHGPFSHALEHSIVKDVSHEDISLMFMQVLNEQFEGKLNTAIQIFNDTYPKKFLHQLVSGQLDMDRLDYLKRDSFYTGVSEGVISSDRIIKMLNVENDELVVDVKGIYSIEKFIIARRLMYWQVYMHKTVVAAESLLVHILKRAKHLAEKGEELFATPAFKLFLYHNFHKNDFLENPELLTQFALLDDNDVTSSIKVWTKHSDLVLSNLCSALIDRKLFKIEINNGKIAKEKLDEKLQKVQAKFDISKEDAKYFVYKGELINNAYNPKQEKINILFKDGSIKDVADASDQLNISVLSKAVKKYYICFPKWAE